MGISNRSQIGPESSCISSCYKMRRRTPLAGIVCSRFAEWALLTLGFCIAPVLVVCGADVDDPVAGKNGPKRLRAHRDDSNTEFQRKARALPSQDSFGDESDELLRIRIKGPDGVFMIYVVAIPESEPRKTVGYVAYWRDKLEASLYLYDRLLVDSIDG